jgi:preprotein translocase subunit SecF
MRVREAIATFRGHRVPNIDFIKRRVWWFALSGTFMLLSLVGLFGPGLNFSIEFKGGSVLEFPNKSEASVSDYQTVLARFGLSDARIEILGSGTVQIRTRSLTELGFSNPTPSSTPSASVRPTVSPTASPSATPTQTPTPTASATSAASPSSSSSPAVTPSATASTPAPPIVLPTLKGDQLRAALARTAGISVDLINEQDVGPTWGKTISRKMITGLIVFVVLVTIYISWRFEPKMAAGALVALAHDLIITAGVYALVGREVTPETVIAILTILGYSLYDTVVIFDKIKENTESISLVARETYTGMTNLSLNQTFMRSVNTSLVVLLPIGALLLFGGQTLKDFAFALFIGVASGTYSSIFVAAPTLALLKEREPRYQQIRARAEARSARPGLREVSRPKGALAGQETRQLELDGGGATGERAPIATARSASRPSSGGAAKRKKGKPQGKAKRRRR